jgi:hypothetical protein
LPETSAGDRTLQCRGGPPLAFDSQSSMSWSRPSREAVRLDSAAAAAAESAAATTRSI